MPQLSMHSPVGDLSVSEENGVIVSLDWGWGRDQEKTPVLKEAIRQLNEYFDGRLKEFNLPLGPMGTQFQENVWSQMNEIPYGKVRTYADIAKRLKSSARAVGGACGRNLIPILIPCHRVVAANGGLGGYSGDGGLQTKTALLTLEGCEAFSAE